MTEFSKTLTYDIECPTGDGGKVIKVGEQSGHQRYKCKACGKKFRDSRYSKGKKFTIQQVGTALGGYFDGLSYREVSRNLERTFKIDPPGDDVIYKWVQAYAKEAVKAVSDVKAETGPEWVADETMVKIDGHPYWLWNVMDAKTRYILAAHLARDRNTTAAKKVMRMAKAAAANIPKRIRTDRLKSYPAAIKDAFDGKVEHIQTDGIAAAVNNNLSERLQGTIKERDKVLRGFKRPSTAQNYLDGWVLDYNYFRPHLALDKATPASKAKVKAPFDDWEGVVRTVDTRGKRVGKATRPREMRDFKPKKKLGRPRIHPRGRNVAVEGRPIDAPKPKSRKRRPVAYSERPVSQKSLDSGKR